MTHSFTTWECTGHGQRWEWNITAWWISFIIHRVNMEWHKWLNDDISQCSTFIKSIKCLLHNSQWNETTFNCNLMHLPFERKFRDMLPCSLKWKYHKKRSRIRESGFRGRRWAIPIKMKEIWWETIRIRIWAPFHAKVPMERAHLWYVESMPTSLDYIAT